MRILREYERAVIFRLGKLIGAKGPGLVFLIPMVDRMVRMDLRVITINVAKQEVMTRDNVPVTVDAVVYFRIVDPEAAVVKVENFLQATSLIAQTTLRSVLGQSELDELLAHREKINQTLQEIIDRHTGPWGVKVTAVEVRDVDAARHHEAGHGPPGGNGTRAPRQSHQRRGRISGRGKTGAGRRHDCRPAHRAAIALPANHQRNRRRPQYRHHHSPADGIVSRRS